MDRKDIFMPPTDEGESPGWGSAPIRAGQRLIRVQANDCIHSLTKRCRDVHPLGHKSQIPPSNPSGSTRKISSLDCIGSIHIGNRKKNNNDPSNFIYSLSLAQ